MCGLFQLIAYGAQDVYLTNRQQMTFFNVPYNRHNNFTVETLNDLLHQNIIHDKNKIKIINKQIRGFKICPITDNKIKNKDLYMICDICHCYFLEDNIKIWLEDHDNCPNCRSQWTDHQIYKNIKPQKAKHVMIPKKHLIIPKHVIPSGKYKHINSY